jgi:hypothetical protein
MIAAWQVVAKAELPARSFASDPRLYWAALALVLIILLGALVIAGLDRWRKRSVLESSTANDQLARFRELYEQGELSQHEFEQIRASLGPQLRQELQVPLPPPGIAAREQFPPSRETETDGKAS